MFVGLIDTRRRPEPEPEPEPSRHPRRPRRVPWRAASLLAAWVLLIVAAASLPGAAGLALILLAVVAPMVAFERAIGYWWGCKEHRQ